MILYTRHYSTFAAFIKIVFRSRADRPLFCFFFESLEIYKKICYNIIVTQLNNQAIGIFSFKGNYTLFVIIIFEFGKNTNSFK